MLAWEVPLRSQHVTPLWKFVVAARVGESWPSLSRTGNLVVAVGMYLSFLRRTPPSSVPCYFAGRQKRAARHTKILQRGLNAAQTVWTRQSGSLLAGNARIRIRSLINSDQVYEAATVEGGRMRVNGCCDWRCEMCL